MNATMNVTSSTRVHIDNMPNMDVVRAERGAVGLDFAVDKS